MTINRRPYGVGLAYRTRIHHEFMRFVDEIDLLEIATIDYVNRFWRIFQDPDERMLRQAMETFPCVAHGINMSIGSVEPHDQQYLKGTRDFMTKYGIDELTEHTAFHRMDGNDVLSFIAMPFEEASLNWLTRKYNAARDYLGRPFGLENVTYYFMAPNCHYDEAEFLTELTKRTDCTLLLDVTNVFNNATNHDYDPIKFIRSLPGDRIRHLHIAGGQKKNGMWIDNHSYPVMDGVWELVEAALDHTAADKIFLERDTNFDPFDSVMDDVRTAREIFYKHRPNDPPPLAETPAAEKIDRIDSCDPDDSDFADLRSFQRAMIRQVTDKKFWKSVAEDPNRVQEQFPMSAEWQDRWQNCDQKQIGRMAKKWPDTVARNKAMERDLPKMEWSMWSRQ